MRFSIISLFLILSISSSSYAMNDTQEEKNSIGIESKRAKIDVGFEAEGDTPMFGKAKIKTNVNIEKPKPCTLF